MIKALILYFLNIKPTHGYEIQKYIQLNEMNDWTKIQSGSIYYALSKLEKEGLIELLREENVGKKVRKIYQITENGISELKKLLADEFAKPIYDIKSDKFVTYPFISGMGKDVLIEVVKKHIQSLNQEKVKIERWQKIKIKEESLAIEKISFEMMLSSLQDQIRWHEALIDEMDKSMVLSENIGKIIKQMDFSELTSLNAEEINKIICNK